MLIKYLKYITIPLFFLAVVFLLASPTKAAVENGVVDSTYHYAWSENIGWIDFKTTYSNVRIIDSGLTGYAWSPGYGWINLGPDTSGVTNNGAGDLGGYAWGEKLGWIDFSNVSIDNSGYFLGYAANDITGRINFNCANANSCNENDFALRTDWQHQSDRPQCNNNLDDDNDGTIDYPNDPQCASLTDNNEFEQNVALSRPEIKTPVEEPEPDKKIVEELPEEKKPTEKAESPEEITAKEKEEKLIKQETLIRKKAIEPAPESSKTVFDQFKEFIDKLIPKLRTLELPKVAKLFDNIKKLRTLELPKVAKVFDNLKKLGTLELPKVAKLFDNLKEKLLTPRIPETKTSIEKLVPKVAPVALKGEWDLLSQELINKFVFEPLPKNIENLAKKFPNLAKTFKQVGINKLSDISKISNLEMTLPGITKASGLTSLNDLSAKNIASLKLSEEDIGLIASIPIANLPPEVKENIPKEFIFAKTGNGLIDFDVNLTVTKEGIAQQKISTLSGSQLSLAIKPDGAAKKVKGYLVFKKKLKSDSGSIKNYSFIKAAQAKEENVLTNINLSLKSLLDSWFFGLLTFAKEQEEPVEVEEKLVLIEFEYTDEDGDGIYTADIQTPLVEGEYEVITVIEYEDIELGTKAVRLTTVIDPEGYIFEKIGGKEARIPGTLVSLYWLNPSANKYELWPAQDFQQDNPQITDITGRYSYLVPSGTYYILVEAPGYLINEGKPFQVSMGSGVHFNIEMKTKYWYLSIIDWKTIILILIGFMLLYNFYRDRIRDRMWFKKKDDKY